MCIGYNIVDNKSDTVNCYDFVKLVIKPAVEYKITNNQW